MWDWELLKSGAGEHFYKKTTEYSDEIIHFAHAISNGTSTDEYCIHNHAMYEVVVPLAGNVLYLVDGNQYYPEAGSCLIIGPAVSHKIQYLSDSVFDRYVAYIAYAGNKATETDLLAQCVPFAGRNSIGCIYFQPSSAKKLISCIQDIDECASSQNPLIVKLTPILVKRFLAEIRISMEKEKPITMERKVTSSTNNIMLFLNQHFKNKLTLDTVSQHFHLSKNYCNRLFKNEVGMTIMQYITYCRIVNAKQLLNNGTPANIAAMASGFSNYSNFFRAYKNITNHSPREDILISDQMVEFRKDLNP